MVDKIMRLKKHGSDKVELGMLRVSRSFTV